MIAKIQAFIAALLAALSLLQAPPTEAWEPDSAEVTAMAKMLYGECRGCSEKQQRAACRCVTNRVDDERFPNTIIEVLNQPYQFQGYSRNNPVWDSLYQIAYKEIKDWHDGKPGVIGPEFCFFYGDGRRNHFTTAYQGGEEWCEG